MNIRNNDWSQAIGNQHISENATFKAKVKSDSDKVIFTTKEKMGLKERINTLSKLLGISTPNETDKNLNWKNFFFGEKNIEVGLEKKYLKESELKTGTFDVEKLKDIVSRVSAMKQMEKKKAKIELDPSFKDHLRDMSLEELEGYKIDMEIEKNSSLDTPSYHLYLVKDFDKIENFESFKNKVIENDEKEFLNALNVPFKPIKIESQDITLNLSAISEHLDKINKVTDPNKIHIGEKTIQCTQNNQTFVIDTAVAMRKGWGKPTLKAMDEDAFLIDVPSITFKGKTYGIPLIATFDGGGGHVLAQCGRDSMKDTFQKNLQDLVTEHEDLNPFIVAEALRKTDDALFGIVVNDAGKVSFTGEGYEILRANHAEVSEKLGISAEELKKIFQVMRQANNPKIHLMMNPMEIHQALREKNPKVSEEAHRFIKINDKEYDLNDQKTAEVLQGYFEKALSREAAVALDMAVNVYLANPENRKMECITYNRGKTGSFLADPNGTTTLSGDKSLTKTIVENGDFIVSVCDGAVPDGMTVKQLAVANNAWKSDQPPKEYIGRMAAVNVKKAGDDRIIVYAKVTYNP